MTSEEQKQPSAPLTMSIIAAAAAAFAVVIVLKLMDIETQPAVIAGVVGGVVGATVPAFGRSK